MKNWIWSVLLGLTGISCSFLPGSDKRYNENENTVYRLHLNPPKDSKYYFIVSNESKLQMETDDKKVDNISRTTTGLNYSIQRDSIGNLLLQMTYDTIHIYSKTGEKEQEMDASNASLSINPVEKMLGVLKTAQINATISSKGEVTEIKGYKELGAQLINGFAQEDIYGRQAAQSQWDQLIGKGLIKKNLDQLFTIFPDSAIRIGDKWKIESKQEGEFGLNVKTFYRLKDIQDGVAVIESEGELVSDESPVNLAGYSVTANLKGSLDGEYRIETKTGMLLNSNIITHLKGIVQSNGKELPVTIENNLKVSGEKR
jgi:hypothetical protein